MNCKICTNYFEVDFYYRRMTICKPCHEEIIVFNSNNNEEKCEYCGQECNPKSKSRNAKICKDCNQGYKNDQKIIRHYKTYKDYYEKKKEDIIAKSKAWNKDNKDKRAEQKKNYRDRHKDETNFRIKENLGTRLRNIVKKDGTKFIDFLQCDISFLKKWLEYNFTEDMNWDNYGTKWHIDHIQPCASFDLENQDEAKVCWHWSNLAPLDAKENAGKGNKIIKEVIDYYQKRKVDFENLIEKEKVQRA